MIGTIIGIILLLGIAVVMAVAGYALFKQLMGDRDGYVERDGFVVAVSGGVFFFGLLGFLLLIGLMSGDVKLTDVPPGCYRISDSVGTGVGTVGGKVGVIVTSDRRYEPISCP